MIVVTALTNYQIEDIQVYVESLNDTGFDGRKIVLYYDPEMNVYEYLKENGWEVYTYDEPENFINFQRRKDIPELLKKLDIRNEIICFTDMKDVYFNESPDTIDVKLYIGADIFTPIKDHEWNSTSIKNAFPTYYETVKNETCLCAGVIIGEVELIIGLFTESYKIGMNSTITDLKEWKPIDQPSVNVAAYTKYRDIIQNPKPSDKIVLNMGNLHLTENIDIEGYKIYHQYARHEWINFL